ncbi:hypothetical protein BT96DRAFT_992658 [Gymnopus androsaceus JB14]|uniref:Uncharacterized protein n=1 Tax=Gymnopus androsaceus JB14 TaxID=1447944 RepID=A0A6A4HSN9_9AGAR|nr:hypothetical protein BT96DRAFT_992658 [Gymnopus androsaceus JB14]
MHASSQSSFIRPIWPQGSNSARVDAPPRLLKSPFQLASSSPTIERPPANSHRASQRKRHCARVDCPVQSQPSSSSVFDNLPWISAMDLSPDEYNLDDIADLSQLPLPASSVEENTTTRGAGPVRRRKTSLHRTSPLRAASGSSTQSIHHPSSVLRHRPVSITSPSTPRPRLARSRIAFHDLMPLFTCDIHKYRSSNPSSPAH